MADLTPETALAMASAGRDETTAQGVASRWNRYSLTHRIAKKNARDILRALDLLGFEVRAKDKAAEVYDCELDPPCSEEEWKRRVAAARAEMAKRKDGAT